MTEAEREAYICRVIDAAPPLSSEDANRIRRLIPLASRLSSARAAVSRPIAARTTAA